MSKKKSENIPLKDQIKPIFKERFLEMLNNDNNEYEKFVEYILKPQRKSFRINTIKENNPQQLIENLKQKGLDISKIEWCENAFFLNYEKDSRTDIGNLKEHILGKIYIQEATSMTPVILLDIPQDIDNTFTVLDMAASPGSKTTQIGSLMNNKGIIIANELDYKRLSPLKINLEKSGLINIVITNNDATKIEGNNIFDRILLDAPCSGSGVIRKSPKTIKTYNPKQLKQICKIQLKLLQRGFELLKQEGIITYSTCSLDPEENELLIEEFLNQNKNAELMTCNIPNLILNNKLTKFFKNQIPEEITQKTIRIWPQDNDTNGFFVAKIKKN